MTKKSKPTLAEVTKKFGAAHAMKAKAEAETKKYRKMFFDLIEIPEDQLAQQTIFAVTEDPDQYVATFYPKWRIISSKVIDEGSAGQDAEWKLVIQEDPDKKAFQYINSDDKYVYSKTVVESAPGVDLDKLKEDQPLVYQSITFQPEVPRQLKPLDQLTDDQKEVLKQYLTPPGLTEKMNAPREAKPEELESLNGS